MRLAIWVLAVAATAAAFYLLSRDLFPPRTLTFAAGAPGGGYSAIAERYKEILARDGIDVTVVATEGSVENARLLAERAVQAGLLQGGVEPGANVETAGSLFFEPVFFFSRRDGDVPRNPALWSGLRIAAGRDGSGARAAMMDFARAAGQEPDANTLLPLGGEDAADALLSGEADLAIFVAPVGAPYLLSLFASDDVALLSLDHIQTLARRLPQSSLIDLPSGAFSLDPPVPEASVQMLALVARLAIDPALHPSLVDRLVEAAREIHGNRDAISGDGVFPTMDFASLPQDAYARDLIASGPSPLAKYLPYWVVAQISRFAILLVPIVFLLLPLLRALPGLYVWRIRRRVFKYYNTIRALDEEALTTREPARLDTLEGELDQIDKEIAGLPLPPSYRDFAYNARLHIDLVRKRIGENRRDPAV